MNQEIQSKFRDLERQIFTLEQTLNGEITRLRNRISELEHRVSNKGENHELEQVKNNLNYLVDRVNALEDN